MVQVLQYQHWKKEKGLTVMEIIVSLTILVIVSLAVLSVALYSFNVQTKANVRQRFSHMVNDVVMMYQTYENDDFELAFNKYTGQTITYGTDTIFYFDESFNYHEEEGSQYYLNCDFESDSFHISACYIDNTVIHERSVAK